ncbi:universal stress protein [Ammoniphilus resinae]|uniref:Nucleotide-binding universal stress UspA family protein n=1 Tax=Ammoniphilus resinae TaxID=861532 RepID=A0ABS4GS00_9BACL|nr:universal stress protein [Ammoniphilus resinae]MBP1933009.1 nucleotide-binding universal stress UspA family protein [Ammoniphilus resinae]
MMYSKILVPYDGSEESKKALEMAKTLLKQDETIELVILNVVTILTNPYYTAYGYFDDPLREEHLKAAKKALEEVGRSLKDLPNKTQTFVEEGNPALAIVDFVKENGVDLIVMGSRGLGGIKEMFLGSVSHYVVQKSPCPVFIMK